MDEMQWCLAAWCWLRTLPSKKPFKGNERKGSYLSWNFDHEKKEYPNIKDFPQLTFGNPDAPLIVYIGRIAIEKQLHLFHKVLKGNLLVSLILPWSLIFICCLSSRQPNRVPCLDWGWGLCCRLEKTPWKEE